MPQLNAVSPHFPSPSSLLPGSLSLHPCLSFLNHPPSLWVSVPLPPPSPPISVLWVSVPFSVSVRAFLSGFLSPPLSLPLSPCPLLLCVRSSSGSLTARIQLQFTIWSRARGASGPRTWWCQCWGGQGAASSRPGCRTCCDAGWCGLPRAQVTEAGWPLPIPPASLACGLPAALHGFLSHSLCLSTPVSLHLTITLRVSL